MPTINLLTYIGCARKLQLQLVQKEMKKIFSWSWGEYGSGVSTLQRTRVGPQHQLQLSFQGSDALFQTPRAPALIRTKPHTHTQLKNFLIFKNRRITKVGRRYEREWGGRKGEKL